ncbi:MAG: ribosome-associated translation inhibitor RaiA [Bacteroidales bacterium]|nr:ribosome-associated translation inhibitor RaiA [Bacteroidales bacterium]MCF8390590.1 ribosome-associated translation inhibitor RaiA [Bacteroidales bacterium]
MDLKVHSIHFDADSKLLDFIDLKVNKLLQFYEDIIKGEVFLRLENVDDKDNKIVEIRLEIPGNPIFAKKQCKTFEEATDLCVEALKKQLNKAKRKQRPV